MRRLATLVMLASTLAVGCAVRSARSPAGTLAELREMRPDVEEIPVEQGLQRAMEGYRRYLEEAPETSMTPEAMRRLADLQLEQEFGIHGGTDGSRDLAAPESGRTPSSVDARAAIADGAPSGEGDRESDREFEARATAAMDPASAGGEGLPEGAIHPGDEPPSGPLEAIALYDRLLAEYPEYEHRDQVLYQKARAYDELGRTEEAIETMERLIAASPYSEHVDEVQFRRGEYFFTRRRYRDAESAYGAILAIGPRSSYYEYALYKLGWTLYKQELYEDALHRYMAVLDYKLSIGYDFDQAHEEDDERRVADTFRVISLSFSNLGGPEAIEDYFAEFGERSYEDRVYANLGEHYLAKLRYDDAAKTYRAFVALHPFHRQAPLFGMRVVDTFTEGAFPKLVLEAKREFATTYALDAEYWRHFAPEDLPEVVAYLESDLNDLATHYHALYQDAEDGDDRQADYREALRWYGDYLRFFPEDGDTPSIHYRYADLLLEHGDFGDAAREYERTAYDYPTHEQSAAAGYAAVYAHRQRLAASRDADDRAAARRETVASSLRFSEAFPDHEHAATVLAAAADDQYEMKDYAAAVDSATRVVDGYPDADGAILRSAWIVVAHGSFDLARYPEAERAYGRVLAATPQDDESYAGFVDNLAASIYRQGQLADEAGDPRAAADHFLRVRTAAPTSTIRPTAEYDAGVALIALENWTEAAEILETFRATYAGHPLELEATRLIAHAYREDGRMSRAADEYVRVATETEDPAVRGEALLVAGDLYERSGAAERALDAYGRYVQAFPDPVELALETRAKIAAIHETAGDDERYREALAEIVRVDAEAGPGRTARTRTIAGRSALVLAERLYRDFAAVELRQPFETSLQDKRRRMDLAMDRMARLVDYEIADVTAAATFYMAEGYLEFSRALERSERPADLEPGELAEYELALEETAFPFEEKAIELHEKNLELLHTGVFNGWTEKSLGRLAEMVPGRYARDELSGGFLAEVDRYEYRSPGWDVVGPPPPSGNAGATPTDGADDPVETTRAGSGRVGVEREVDDAIAP